jgi:hypothetical protein
VFIKCQYYYYFIANQDEEKKKEENFLQNCYHRHEILLSISTNYFCQLFYLIVFSIYNIRNMKFIILFVTFIFINSISISDSAYCQCQCCIKPPGNDDCQQETIGNVTIDNCPTDSTECVQKCEGQYPAQCGRNDSLVESMCFSYLTTSTVTPPMTTAFNGPFQCKCSCCSTNPCTATYQGNAIVDNCEQCPKKCAEQYPSQCGTETAMQQIECGAEPTTPSNHTYRINSNIFLLFLFIFSKELFL